jgi:hypothetical protein
LGQRGLVASCPQFGVPCGLFLANLAVLACVYAAPALQRRFAGYQLASVIAGGPAPLIATALFASYHSGYAISIYIAACAVVSLVATAMMTDYTGQDISMEYDN